MPFLYAAAAYGLFHFLDKKASGQAKSAISSWLKSQTYSEDAVRSAVVEMFDRIYGRPLLRLQSFGRSATISLVLSVLYIGEFFRDLLVEAINYFSQLFTISILVPVLFNVCTDYISLFFVRRYLTSSWTSPKKAMIVGALVGVAAIWCMFLVRFLVEAFLSEADDDASLREATETFLPEMRELVLNFSHTRYSRFLSTSAMLFLPAMATHLWLPLFVFGAIGVRLVNSFVWATEKMQWFLKRGRDHPYQAIGYVAAAIVFVGTALISLFGWAFS